MSGLLGSRSLNQQILDRTREEALNHEGGYIFDLDGQENAEDGGMRGKFSVDAEICGMVLTLLRIPISIFFPGNWTRFIKYASQRP